MRVHTRFRALSCVFVTLVYISSEFCARTSLAQSNDWPLTRNDHLRRVSFLNDDGDVYVESSGTGSEIVLKTGKVRVSDGDVYCGTSIVGLSAEVDALTPQDDAFDSRMNALNDTHPDLRNDLNALDATSSGRFASVEATLASLASTDASLLATDASLSNRVDALNAADAQLEATDETLKTHISSLNATDAALKGVDDGLSSRIDALRDIYVNELNVTDEQLIVTDAKLGSRIDALNATQYELRGVDTGLSSRLDTLKPLHVEYERTDDEVAALIESLNATDATMQLEDSLLSNRVDELNATSEALSAVDASLSARIASLKPPKCTEPGGDELLFNGTNWECVCQEDWTGPTCEMPKTFDFADGESSFWGCGPPNGLSSAGSCSYDTSDGAYVLSDAGFLTSSFKASRAIFDDKLKISVRFKASSSMENIYLIAYYDAAKTDTVYNEGSGVLKSDYCGCSNSGGQPPHISVRANSTCVIGATNVHEERSTASYTVSRLENIFTYDSDRFMTMNLTHDATNKFMSTEIDNGLDAYKTVLGYESIQNDCFTSGRVVIVNRPIGITSRIYSIRIEGELTT